jgi:hypothetical protein
MTQLEFWHDKDELVIGYFPAGDASSIPYVGDLVDVPDAANPGTYVYVKVTGRRFYYKPSGELRRAYEGATPL